MASPTSRAIAKMVHPEVMAATLAVAARGVVVFDAAGAVLYGNAAACRLFRHTAGLTHQLAAELKLGFCITGRGRLFQPVVCGPPVSWQTQAASIEFRQNKLRFG